MAENDFPHETCCGPLIFCEGAAAVSSSAEQYEVVVEEEAATNKFRLANILLGEQEGATENADDDEIPMTEDTADVATMAVPAFRGRRDCRETIIIYFCSVEFLTLMMSWPNNY